MENTVVGYRTNELKYSDAHGVDIWQFEAGELAKMKADFQRPVNPTAVATIVRKWDTRLFEQPTVFILPDDTCVLGEGQHRVAAAVKKLGPRALITCRVISTDKPGAMFVAISQSKRRVEQIHVFNAEVADGDVNSVGAKDTAEKYGFTVSKSGGARAIAAAKTVVDAYAADPKALDSALYVINKIIASRGDELGWLKSNVIKTLWYITRNYNVKLDTLATKVAKRNPDAAVPYSVNDLRRNSEEIIRLYNSGKRDENRIDPTKPKYPDRAWH